MKAALLTSAIFAVLAHRALPPQAGPRKTARPHIEPLMRLQPSAAAADTYELLVYGDIGESWWGESVTAAAIAQQLNDLPDTVATINVRINSYGGSVADGLAIYNALRRHKATKAVTVDGVAMSSASLIAMAGSTVTMPPTSILMIHAPWGGLYGNAREMRQYADVLDKFSDAMADAYVAKSGMDRNDVIALLTDGDDHYYTGDEAVAAGFADAVAEDYEEGEPDENARAFAAAMLTRVAASCPARYVGMAVAAAMRGEHYARATAAVPPTPAPRAQPKKPNPAAPAVATQPAPAGAQTGDATVDEEEKKAAAKAALAADKQRREAIRNRFAPFLARGDLDKGALDALQKECEDDHDTTAEAAGHKLLDFLGKETTPTGGVTLKGDARDLEVEAYRAGAVKALLHRSNPGAHKLDEQAQQFRGMSLLDMARDCAERAGHRMRGMSRAETAIKGMMSTSDFPQILEQTVTRTLRAGYANTPRTFTAFSRQGTLPDFKKISRVSVSGAPDLKRVLEGAEYEYGVLGTSAEEYRLQKYGRIVALTWETIINDDLDALTRIPQMFGASAAELESDIVYGILTGNPLMSDGKALFHADHGNVGTPGALIDAVNPNPAVANPLADMRTKMILQKGIEGRYVSVRPKFLIVPPGLEEAALRVTNAAIVAARGNDANVVGPTLSPIVEARLHDADPDAWYGAADPNSVDTIEFAYLEGHEGVFTETKTGFEIDGVHIKCRHVFGAKAIDYRGLYRNVGATPEPYPPASP